MLKSEVVLFLAGDRCAGCSYKDVDDLPFREGGCPCERRDQDRGRDRMSTLNERTVELSPNPSRPPITHLSSLGASRDPLRW